MSLIELLESGRQDVLGAVEGLTEVEALAKPSLDRWSALECLEHVVIVEERFQGWLENGTPIASVPRPENESRLFSMVTDRKSRVAAPEAVVPSGRYSALKEAVAAFNATRDRSVNLVKERGEALYTIGARHARFGDLNGVEVIHLLVGHAGRHAAQIREIRQGDSDRKTP
jgi:hypothetical protein